MKNRLFQTALILVAIVLSVFIYRSVMRPEKFRVIYETRRDVVIEKLKEIRTAQIAYKNTKGMYANDFDQLINFLTDGKMAIVVKTGTVPDDLTEQQALKKGIIKRDTVFVDAFTEIFKDKPNIDVKGLKYIPFSNNQTFEMKSDTVEKGRIKVPVFRVIAPKTAFLNGIDAELAANSKGFSGFFNVILFGKLQEQFQNGPKYIDLIMGSLEEPSTDGNWE